MTDDRDKRRPPSHDRLAGKVEESVDPDDITDRFTMLHDTPAIQAAFRRVAERTEDARKSLASLYERDRAETVAVLELLRDRTHDLAGDIAKVAGAAEAHHLVDEERFENMDKAISEHNTRRDESIGEIKATLAERKAGNGRWLALIISIAVGIGGAVIAQWITMDSRVQRVEDRIDAAKERAADHDAEVDRTLEKLDARLDAIGNRLGVPQPTPVPTQLSP